MKTNFLLEILKSIPVPRLGIEGESGEPTAETQYYIDKISRKGEEQGIFVECYCGSTQVCFYDKNDLTQVFKLPFTFSRATLYDKEGYEYDEDLDLVCNYTKQSELLSELAIKEGISCFFALVKEIALTSNGVPIYTQPYVTPKGKHQSPRSNSITTKEYSTAKSLRQSYFSAIYELNVSWIADCIFYYGEELFLQLIDFIKDHGINDLHSDNYGWDAEGRPRLFDFCGFYEEV